MKKLPFVFLLLLFSGCYKEKRDYIADAAHSYSDDFESYANADSLYSDAHWSANQLTVDGNTISIDTIIVHSGNQSLRCFAKPTSSEIVSKAGLLKNNLAFENNSVVEYEAWYFIESQQSLSNLFLVDFEDPAYISASPGFRIMVNANGELCAERKKMNHSTLQQTISTPRVLPKGQWVKLKLEFKLSQRKKGYIKIWQDDELILEHNNIITLAKDFIYVTQGTAGFLRQVEPGITANGSTGEVVMYVDDLKVRQK